MKVTTLVISAALTVFSLLILSGVAYSVKHSQAAAAAVTETQAVQADAGQTPSQDFAEREAAYQQLINHANQRLAEAQAEIERLQSQAAQVPAQASISIEEAAQIAASYLGQTEIYSAENSTINGLPVYSITFSSGDIVLVSDSGQVLTVRPAEKVVTSLSPSGNQEHEDHEHEEHENEGSEFEGFEHED